MSDSSIIETLRQQNFTLRKEIRKLRVLTDTQRRDSEQRYQTLASIYPVGIFHIGANDGCSYINARCAELLGMSFAEAQGSGWRKAVHPDDIDRFLEKFANTALTGATFQSEYRLVHTNGEVVWVHGEIIAQQNEDGETVGYIGTATDITKLRETERQLQERKQQLEQLTRLSTLGELSASIAHQLNQPLTAIVHYAGGILERLKTETVTADIMQTIKRVSDQAERAGSIVNELRTFLKLGALQKSSIDLNETIIDIMNLVANMLDGTGIKVKLDLAEELPQVEADKLHIEQATINVISNAIDVLIDVEKTNRKLAISTASIGKNAVQIKIRNSGPKLDQTILHRLFEPLFTTKKHGMGMGLAIASSIMRSHGGYIAVETDSSNTCFLLTLPICGNFSSCKL